MGREEREIRRKRIMRGNKQKQPKQPFIRIANWFLPLKVVIKSSLAMTKLVRQSDW